MRALQPACVGQAQSIELSSILDKPKEARTGPDLLWGFAPDGRRNGRSNRREASISRAVLRLRRRRRPYRHPQRRQPPRQVRTQSEASQYTRLPRRYRRP